MKIVDNYLQELSKLDLNSLVEIRNRLCSILNIKVSEKEEKEKHDFINIFSKNDLKKLLRLVHDLNEGEHTEYKVTANLDITVASYSCIECTVDNNIVVDIETPRDDWINNFYDLIEDNKVIKEEESKIKKVATYKLKAFKKIVKKYNIKPVTVFDGLTDYLKTCEKDIQDIIE